ncbi:hypothetical protein BGZ65_008182, partial [Modicella reniformis]
MKTFLAFGAVIAVASAAPLVEIQTKPEKTFEIKPFDTTPLHKQMLGGLSVPSSFASVLHSHTAPINYGNLNMGTGMMPSQVVHYGTENYPDRGFVGPKLISTTAKEVDFQIAQAEHARNLLNLDADIAKIGYADLSKYADYWNQ